MNGVRFIKSFSKGQITIPKDIRDFFGIDHEFWLKIYIDHGKIIAEPVEKKNSKSEKEEYKKKLLSIQGDWFDEEEYKKVRKEVGKHFEKNLI